MDSLRGAIRGQVMRGIDGLTPETDKDFMDDLASLMAAQLTMGEQALDGTGLFSLMFAINPDETRPWTERGFLSASDARASL